MYQLSIVISQCYIDFLHNICGVIKVFPFTGFLNEMYTCTICSEEGLMKMTKNV